MENLTFTSMGLATGPAKLPSEYKMGLFRSLDKRFVTIFLIVAGILLPLFLIGALQEPPKEATLKDIEEIQQRYARLVLNKEIPKKEEKKKVKKADEMAEKKEEPKEEKEEEKKESVEKRKERKEATAEKRQQQRAVLKKQIENIGIFAELTATSGSGRSGRRTAKDLIGNTDASASLSNLNLSGASFVSKKAEDLAARERRGERSEGGTLAASGLTEASSASFKSAGTVEMAKVNNIEGEAANDASRSMSALNGILRKYQPRLIKVYEDYLKRNPELSGKLVVKFTIEADGSVSDVQVVSSDLNNPELEGDIVRRIERIKFPAASGKITIEWPLVFTAG